MTSLQDLIQTLSTKMQELKDTKGLLRDLETDLPMELEDLNASLNDLKKQVKEKKDAHIKSLIESNNEYNDYREQIQELKEEIANAKLQLFTEAANLSREHGDLDQTVVVEGAPQRLQTQKDILVYLNGKLVK